MPDSVATRVAERLAIQPQQSERVLRALARLIKSQSARDGRVRVPGLGIFAHSDEGIAFEPDRRLAEAVNTRYAGLEPVPIEEGTAPPPEAISARVPISPAEPSAPPAEELPTGEEEPASAPDTSPENVPADEESEFQEQAEQEALPDGQALDEQPDDAEEPEPVMPAISEVEAHAPVEDEALAEDSHTKETLDTETVSGPVDEAEPLEEPMPDLQETDPQESLLTPPAATRTPREPADLPPRPPRRPVSPDVSQQRSPWLWLTLVAVVLLGALGAYYWFNLRTPPAPPLATNDTETVTPPEETVPTEEAPLEDDLAQEDLSQENLSQEDVPQEEQPSESDTEPSATESDTEPLALAPAEGGYTWIVGSHTSRADAEAQLARFREQLSGQLVRIGVLTGTSNGQTRYRVGIGQVPTPEEADALRTRLGDVLPSDAWLRNVAADT